MDTFPVAPEPIVVQPPSFSSNVWLMSAAGGFCPAAGRQARTRPLVISNSGIRIVVLLVGARGVTNAQLTNPARLPFRRVAPYLVAPSFLNPAATAESARP